MHCDFDCDVHFPDLAPFGLPLNSADKSLEGLKTDFLLVKVEDTDVQVLHSIPLEYVRTILPPGGSSFLREWNQVHLPRVPV